MIFVDTEQLFIEVGTGVSQVPDGYGAGRSAASDARLSIRQFPLSVVLVYASVHYDLDQVLAGISANVGNVPILGTTTAGEICGGAHQHSVTVVVIASSYLSVHAAIGNGVAKDWRRALTQAIDNPAISTYVKGEQNLSSDLTASGNSLFAMIFYPGNTRAVSSMGYELLESFKQINLGRIPVFGGASADDWHMESNAVFLGGQVHHDSVLVAIFETQLEVGISLGHGFLPIGQKMTVTAIEGHELISLDQSSAADVMANCMGKNRDDLEGQHITLTTGFPIGSPDPMGQYSVNIASYFTQRGGVRMTQPVSVGSELTLLGHDADNSVLAGQEAVRKAMIRAGTNTPALILVNYCALRSRIIGESLAQIEIGNLLDIAGPAPMAGFFSFGEDAVADDGISRHNNGAVAVLVLGKQFSAIAKVAQKNKQLLLQIAEQERANAANLSRVMFENSPSGMVAVDPKDGRIIQANNYELNMLGYTSDEILTKTVADVTYPEDRQESQQHFEELSGGLVDKLRYEKRLLRKDGSYFWAEVNVSSLKDNSGKTHLYIGNSIDISERKVAEAQIKKSLSLLNATLESTADAILVVDLNHKWRLYNQQFVELWNIPDEISVAKDDKAALSYAITQLVDADGFLNKVHELYTLPKATSFDTLKFKDGRIVERYSIPQFVDGEAVGRVWSFRDVTVSKKAESELRIAATAFESHEGMIITDANGTILRINHAFTEITGYTAEEVIGKNPRMLSSGKHDKAFYIAMWESINRTGVWEGEIWNKRKNGEVYPEFLTITAVKNPEGIVSNYVSTLADITLSREAADEIKYLAFYDPLTRLPNRRLLMDRLQKSLSSSLRSGRVGALLFIDLDDFKALNDTLGHNMGDLLLQQVAKRLESCVREGDTVARLGGDEFVVMLEDLSDQTVDAASQTEAIGGKILATLNQTYQLAEHTYRNSSSIGITLFKDNQQSVDELMKQADIAMYQSKKAGRNTLRFFDRVMQETVNARAALEGELHHALEKNQFQLYYQIQVDSNRRALGAEALIRWVHPLRGMVSPAEFIPLAEDTGLILPIGKWVLNTACAQLRAWQQNDLTRNLTLSVNVSAKQFHEASFVEEVKTAVQFHSINPMQLKLEPTESVLLGNIDEIVATMKQLKDIGVQFSLDDFGTGYSSLQYLKKLPLNQLKIDQSFVRDLARVQV